MKFINYSIQKSKLVLVAFLISTIVTLFDSANAQTVLLSPSGAGGFESGSTFALNGWTAVNGSNNKWYVGTPQVPSAGTYGAYIDKNTAGPYQYNVNAAFTNHIYKDIAFPTGATNINLSFKWKCQGESIYDYLQAFLVPTSTTPVAGTQLASGQLGSNLNLNGGTSYSTSTFTLSNAIAGTTQRLVFTWVNDASLGTQPPAAVDEVSVTYSPPCSGTPTGGTTVSSSSSPCSGANFTLSLTGNSAGTGIIYQWKSSPTGSGYTNISGATNATLTISQTSSTYYQCLVTCTSSGFSATSSALQVNMNSYGACGCAAYATSNATDIADDEILNVTLGTLNNTSTCGAVAGGPGSIAYEYSNYSGVIAGPSLTQGLAYSGGVKIGFCDGIAYTTSFAVYIDYNQNGSFADAGELVNTQQGLTAAVAGTVFPFSITIPATATTGFTRMRVVNVEGSLTPSPTGTYTWGETEDYCVTIVAGTQCSGFPAASTTVTSANPACYNTAFNLSLSSTYTNLGITYQWQSAPDVSGVPGTFTNISGATASTYSATQTSIIWYHCLINCTNSGQTTTSSNLKITTQLCYCVPSYATGCSLDRISNFILNTLSNNSGATCVTSPAGYSVYGTSPSNQTTTLTPGTAYTSTITVVTGNANGTGVAIWIDYNDNGVFDVSENNNNGATKFTSNTTGTLVVNIPVNAPPGQHRMRVRSMRNTNSNAIDPCLAGNATGEAEDYTVTIADPSASSNPVCEGDTLYLFAIPTGASSYSWSGPNGFFSTLQNPKIAHATAAAAGLYTVNIIIGSNTYTPSTTAVFNAKPSVSATSNAPFCSATQNLNLQTTAPTGISYAWTGPGGFTSTIQNPTISTPSNTSSGSYKVVVTDANACRDSSTLSIVIYALPNIGITVIGSTNICSGQTTTDLQATGAGVTGAYTWSNSETTSLITVSNAGNFSVTGTDANGCNNSQSQVITASNPPVAPVVSPTGTLTLCFNSSGPIAQNISCTNYSANLLWSTSETTSSISVDYEDIFNVTYTDINGCFSNSDGITTVFDGIAPNITCPTDVVSCNTSPALGSPTTSDNCSVALVSNDAPAVFPAGNTDVTWTVTDYNSNSSTCIQHVFINTAPVINTCPANISQCDVYTATWTDPTATGTPAASVSCSPASGSTFAAGTTSVTCTATNSCGSSSCSFNVTINETPVISACPSNISQCDNHVATWTDPTATGTPAASVSCSPASGSTFATGTTSVTCTATNSCGSSSCSFNVTINETPVISACPANISQCDVYTATWTDPTATGTPAATVTCSPASGSTFAAGTTSVTCTATNSCGSSSCSFNVTINETPVIGSCPANITTCNPVVTFSTPTATGTPAPSVTCSPASGSTFALGTTIVTCTATNSCGSSSCSFTVNVQTPSTAATSATSNALYGQVCVGGSVTLTANGGSLGTGASWVWYDGGCGAGASVGSGSPLTITPALGNHNYFVRAEGACGSTACVSVAVNVISAPPSNTIGITAAPTDGCVGSPAQTVSVNAVANCTFYNWSSSQAGVRFNGNPSPFQTTVPTVNVTFVSLPAAGASGWSICVFGGNACGNTNTICTWVRATVSMPSSITGSVIGCPGTSGNAYSSSTVAGAASYQWSSTGGIVVTGNGAQAVTVAFPGGFVSGTLSVRGQTACGYQGPNRAITITANPSIPGTITGPSYPCPNASASFSIAAVPGATNYQWTTSVPGAVVTGTTTSCSIAFPTIIPAGSTVSVVAKSSCPTSSATRSKGISNGLPGVPFAINGPASGQCGQTGVSYTINPVFGATGYNWIASCGIIQGPNNLSGITIDWPGSFTTCTLSVFATNACGTGIARTLVVFGAPAIPASIAGNAVPCANSLESYSASSVGATSYNWTVPAGATILGPANGPSINVLWGATSGNITVTASNTCGTSGVRSLPCVISCRQSQVTGSASGFNAEVYPNPATEKATVKFTATTAAQYHLNMTDVIGRNVLSTDGTATEGINMIDLDLNNLAKGVYMLNIKSGGDSAQISVVVE